MALQIREILHSFVCWERGAGERSLFPIFPILWNYNFAILQDTTLRLGIFMLLPAVLTYLSYMANHLKWEKPSNGCISIEWKPRPLHRNCMRQYHFFLGWSLNEKNPAFFHQVQSLITCISFFCCTVRDTRRQACDIRKTFIKYCIVGWGVPAVAVILCAVLDFTGTFHFGYGL